MINDGDQFRGWPGEALVISGWQGREGRPSARCRSAAAIALLGAEALAQFLREPGLLLRQFRTPHADLIVEVAVAQVVQRGHVADLGGIDEHL